MFICGKARKIFKTAIRQKDLLPGRSPYGYWNRQEFYIFGSPSPCLSQGERGFGSNRAEGQPVLPRCLSQDGTYYWQIHLQNRGGPPHENRYCCSYYSGGCCCGSKHARCLHCCSTSRHADPIAPAQRPLHKRNIPILFYPCSQQPADFSDQACRMFILTHGKQIIIPSKTNPYSQLLKLNIG